MNLNKHRECALANLSFEIRRSFSTDPVENVTSGLSRDFPNQNHLRVAHTVSRKKISLVGYVKSKPLLSTLQTGQMMSSLSLKVHSIVLENKFPKLASESRKFPENFLLEFFGRVAYVVVRRVEEDCKIKVFGRLGVRKESGSFNEVAGSKPVLICSSFVLLESKKESDGREEEFQEIKEPSIILRKPEELCDASILFPEEHSMFSSSLQYRQDENLDNFEQYNRQEQDTRNDSLSDKDWSLWDNIF
ncbi:hypothetical protein Gasu2_25500 [Galdieria sulphuraria]|nr:hypothetical protein Gasu2_25500 [Galdieria sulphuraria]